MKASLVSAFVVLQAASAAYAAPAGYAGLPAVDSLVKSVSENQAVREYASKVNVDELKKTALGKLNLDLLPASGLDVANVPDVAAANEEEEPCTTAAAVVETPAAYTTEVAPAYTTAEKPAYTVAAEPTSVAGEAEVTGYEAGPVPTSVAAEEATEAPAYSVATSVAAEEEISTPCSEESYATPEVTSVAPAEEASTTPCAEDELPTATAFPAEETGASYAEETQAAVEASETPCADQAPATSTEAPNSGYDFDGKNVTDIVDDFFQLASPADRNVVNSLGGALIAGVASLMFLFF